MMLIVFYLRYSGLLYLDQDWTINPFCFPLPLFFSVSFQAYTSQIAVLAMMALALGEDSISSRERRERIIDGLLGLPGERGGKAVGLLRLPAGARR